MTPSEKIEAIVLAVDEMEQGHYQSITLHGEVAFEGMAGCEEKRQMYSAEGNPPQWIVSRQMQRGRISVSAQVCRPVTASDLVREG